VLFISQEDNLKFEHEQLWEKIKHNTTCSYISPIIGTKQYNIHRY